MPYCKNCGNEIDEKAVICVKCGSEVKPEKKEEVGSTFIWGLIGFMVPVVGLILWLLWKDDYPKRSRSSGIGALVSTILSVVFVVLYFVFIFFMFGYSLTYMHF